MTLIEKHAPSHPEPSEQEPLAHRFTREEYYLMGDAGVFQEEFRSKRVELIDGDILDKDSSDDPPPRVRFTREQYYQMAEFGVFEGKRVELIDGEILDMAPQKNSHVLGITRAAHALTMAFGDAYWVRAQAPLHLADNLEPEPDIAVVPGPMEAYTDHPTTALLVVEISDTTLRFDRGKKASMYARAGIQDYWVVNLIENCVLVMRERVEDAAAAFGWRYHPVITLRVGEGISPLAKPEATIAVADLLP